MNATVWALIALLSLQVTSCNTSQDRRAGACCLPAVIRVSASASVSRNDRLKPAPAWSRLCAALPSTTMGLDLLPELHQLQGSRAATRLGQRTHAVTKGSWQARQKPGRQARLPHRGLIFPAVSRTRALRFARYAANKARRTSLLNRS